MSRILLNAKGSQKMSTARESVYYSLKEDIVNLVLVPGISISEKDISAKYKVSRTPVREAFHRLAQEELLEIYPQKGTFVSLIDLHHVEEARFMREILERAVVKLACLTISDEDVFQLETILKLQEFCSEQNNFQKLFELDEEFHRTIFNSCGKNRTWNIIQQQISQFNRLRKLRVAVNSDWNIILKQHAAILEAIKLKDPDKAGNAMKKHLNLVTYEQDEIMSKYPTYFS